MIINVTSYADFKLAVNTLRHLDAVFYKSNSVNILGNPAYGVIYAFDYQADVAIVAQIYGAITVSTTDFPTAIAIADHMLISDQSAVQGSF